MFKVHVILDRQRYFYSVTIKPSGERKHGISFACVTLCEKPIHRPHLTCLWCRVRRAWYGKMPSKIPVEILVLHRNLNQNHAELKQFVRKILLTLIGWTLN